MARLSRVFAGASPVLRRLQDDLNQAIMRQHTLHSQLHGWSVAALGSAFISLDVSRL